MAPTLVELRSSAAPAAAELALLAELAAALEMELDVIELGELDELDELGTAMAWMTGTAVTLDDQRHAKSAA